MLKLSDVVAALNALHANVRGAIASHPAATTDKHEGKTLFEKIDAMFAAAGADVPTAKADGDAAFDPKAWGQASGEHFDHEFTDWTPVSFDTEILGGVKVSMGCGSGSTMDAEPIIADASGKVLADGYGAHFEVPAPTPAKVTVTPKKVPCQVSINLMRG